MMVPEGWEVKRLSELANIVGGGTPAREEEEYWKNGNIPWATPTDITKEKTGKYIDKTEECITAKGLSSSSAKLIPVNSILLTSRANIGFMRLNTKPMATNQGFASVVPFEDNAQFLYYLLDIYVPYMHRRAYGTTFPEISKTEVKNIPIVIPKSAYEQQKIATILSTLDRTIEATQKLIDKEKMVKKGLMADLLTNGIDEQGRIRSPQTHTYIDSSLGMIPEGWDIRKLGKCVIGTGEYGLNAPAVDYAYWLPTYLRITDIDDSGHFIQQGKKSVIDNDALNYLLQDGDIVFARTGNTTGKTYLYNPQDGPLVFAGFLIRFRPNPKKLLPFFLKFLTETESYYSWVQINSARTGQPGINASEYADLDLILPSIEEQQKIATILSAQDRKIETEEINLAKLQKLKKGLMGDLLSGKVRVK